MAGQSQGYQPATAGDFAAEQEGLARRKKLLDVLANQSMGQGIVGSNLGASVGQGLMKVLTAYLVNGQQEGLQQKQAELGVKQREHLMGELDSYATKRNGKAGDVMSDADAANLMQNDVAPQLEEPVKANPREAILQAMTSQHPEMQNIGKMEMQAMMTQQKDKGFKDHLTQDGSLVRVFDDGRAPQALGNYAKPKDQWSEPYSIQGVDGKPLMVKRNLATNEVDVVDKAPKVTATASANAKSVTGQGETEFAKALGKDVAEEFKGARTAAQAAYKAKSFVGQMQKLEESGIFSGPTANIATTLGAVGQQLGLPVDTAKLANSQAFQQQFASQVANVLTSGGGIGRSMTDADRKAFEQSLPTMLMTPQGRQQVYMMLNNQADQDISRAQSFQQQLLKDPQYGAHTGMLTLNPVDSTPMGRSGGVTNPGPQPVPAPSGAAKPRVTNW